MPDLASRKLFILFTLAAAFLNLLPSFFVIPSGDIIQNYALIDCYSEQFWQGILYPRWCMNPNGGMGSPGPIFYFPLPYYVTALFYPLHSFGLTLDGQYLAGVYLANVVAFGGCVIWLKKIARIEIAYLCAFIFLVCSYRTELLTRASYAEYWCVSLMPLLFHYMRRLSQKPWRTWPKLSIVIALCVWSHAPATLLALMGAGFLLITTSRVTLSKLLEFALSCVLAAMLTLYHYMPMKLLGHTLNDEMGGPSHWQRSWVNSFVDQPQVYVEHQWAVIGMAIGLLAPILVCNMVLFARDRIVERNIYREAAAWVAVAAISCFMLFSVSEPLWAVVKLTSGVITPWRMQSLIMLAMVFCGAVLCQYIWQYRKTRNGDTLIALIFFVFASLFYYGGVAPGSLETHKQNKRDQYLIKYFSVKDLSKDYGSDPTRFYLDFLTRPDRKQAEWIHGTGALSISEWSARGISINGHASGTNTLRLEHFYYPIWQATLNGVPLTITPEPHSGRMLMQLPKGDFQLDIRHDYWALVPGLRLPLGCVFVLAIVIIASGLARQRPA